MLQFYRDQLRSILEEYRERPNTVERAIDAIERMFQEEKESRSGSEAGQDEG